MNVLLNDGWTERWKHSAQRNVIIPKLEETTVLLAHTYIDTTKEITLHYIHTCVVP